MNQQSRQRGLAPRELILLLAVAVAGIYLAVSDPRNLASEQAVEPYPDYPHVNSAICYEFDAEWPSRPGDVTWGPVTGVAVDAEDDVWLCTEGQPPVQVYARDGQFVRGWGSAELEHPHQLRIDPAGFVWVVDGGLHVVRKFTTDGQLLATLGTPASAGCDETHFNTPTDVAVTPAGDVFVTDGYRNSRVVHFGSDGRYVKAWGRLGADRGELSLPHSLVIGPSGKIYVAERSNGRIQVFDQAGVFLDQWRSLVIPWGLGRTPSGDLWVCGSSPAAWRGEEIALATPPRDQLLIKFNPAGRALQQWYVPKGSAPGQLNWVHCIAEDSQGNLYCGDCRANRLQRFRRVLPTQPAARREPDSYAHADP